MYRLFLAGGIASGKSTVARRLASHGALRIDLDQLSRAVLAPGEPCVEEVASAFGEDIVDHETGVLDRGLLAQRAFATDEGTRQLEAIELPYILGQLRALLAEGRAEVCVVEIPLLDRAEEMLSEADEIACVVAPLALRRERAIGRGMAGEDFDRRILQQPDDSYLESKADTVFRNAGSQEDLERAVDSWWDMRAMAGWKGRH